MIELLQLLVITFSAVVAFFTYRNHSDLTRKRATLDLFLSFTKDRATIDDFKILDKCLSDDSGDSDFYKIITDRSDEHKRERDAILHVLNIYEFISAGTNTKLLDDSLLKTLNYSNTLKLWNYTGLGIKKLRQELNKETLFQEFEILVKRWQKKPLKSLVNN